jgi:hypothetical protein
LLIIFNRNRFPKIDGRDWFLRNIIKGNEIRAYNAEVTPTPRL